MAETMPTNLTHGHGVICQYCGCEAQLVQGDFIYPNRPDLRSKFFYYCDNMPHRERPAYVGCHGYTQQPLGTLADRRLRACRNEAHQMFDLIWKSGCVFRKNAYKKLAEHMGISEEECHIGMFDERQCTTVVTFAHSERKRLGL